MTATRRDPVSPDGPADPLFERFSLIVNGPALFNAVVTGVELELFERLSASPGSDVAGLAAGCGVQAERLRPLMLALCATGLVQRSGPGYQNTALADRFLAQPGSGSWRDILIGWQRIYYPAFAQLTPALLAGTNTALDSYPGTEPTLYQRLEHSPELERVLHRSMSAFTTQSLPGLLDHAGLDDVQALLDIGGGDGTTAQALAQRYPQLRITIFDLPSVTGVARERLSDQPAIELVPGDVFDDPFPQGMHAVLFSHFLEVFSPEQILELAGKAYAALPSGGRVLIYGFNAEEDESGGVYSSRLALYLTALATGNGMTYPAADYERWLTTAGFEKVHTVAGLPYEHGLTMGVKP